MVSPPSLSSERVGEHERQRRLGHHRRRRHGARVGALFLRVERLLGRQIDRRQRPRQRRDRLHRRARHQRLAVGDAAFDAAHVVRRPHEARAVVEDGIEHAPSRASPPRRSRRRSPTPFIAWIDISAMASRPSSRSDPIRRASRGPAARPRPRPRRRRRRSRRLSAPPDGLDHHRRRAARRRSARPTPRPRRAPRAARRRRARAAAAPRRRRCA